MKKKSLILIILIIFILLIILLGYYIFTCMNNLIPKAEIIDNNNIINDLIENGAEIINLEHLSL